MFVRSERWRFRSTYRIKYSCERSRSKVCSYIKLCVCVHSSIGSGEISKIFIFSNIYFLSFHFETYLIKYSNYGTIVFFEFRVLKWLHSVWGIWAYEWCSNEEPSTLRATKTRVPTWPILTIAEGSIQSLHVFRTNDGWDYRGLIRANEYDYSAFLTKSFPCACVRMIR